MNPETKQSGRILVMARSRPRRRYFPMTQTVETVEFKLLNTLKRVTIHCEFKASLGTINRK